MKVIHRGRQEGKTTGLIRETAHDPIGLLVVHSHTAARDAVNTARRMGIEIPYPITFEQLIDGRILRGRRVRLYVDNVDMLVQRIAGPVPVELVTFNRHYEIESADTSED